MTHNTDQRGAQEFNVETISGYAGGTDDKTCWNGRVLTLGMKLQEVENLVAAAPEMLEALKLVDAPWITPHDEIKAMAAVRAAIAAAQVAK